MIQKIPFRRYPLLRENTLREEVINEFRNLFENDDCISQKSTKIIDEFERQIASFVGAKHAITVSSGTAALYLSLCTLDLPPKSEIITVSNSFKATTEAILMSGHIPVYIDVDPKTGLIDSSKIEMYITNNTKAIIPVHLYGNCCSMNEIKLIADKYEIHIIEDCAQAICSYIDDSHVGLFGTCGTFSFYPSKTLGTIGEGGVIVTNSNEIAKKIKLLRNHQHIKSNYNKICGGNYRMGVLEAIILNSKLDRLKSWVEKRNNISKRYVEKLNMIKGITFVKSLKGKSSNHLFVIRVPETIRDRVVYELMKCGIEVKVHYPMLNHVELNELLDEGNLSLSNTIDFNNSIISLPFDQYISRDEQNFVIESLKNIMMELL